jgi:hypothetical protein
LGSSFKFPGNTERSGYFVGFADNVGDELKFKILENELVWLDPQQMPVIGIKENHLNQMYKNHLNY